MATPSTHPVCGEWKQTSKAMVKSFSSRPLRLALGLLAFSLTPLGGGLRSQAQEAALGGFAGTLVQAERLPADLAPAGREDVVGRLPMDPATKTADCTQPPAALVRGERGDRWYILILHGTEESPARPRSVPEYVRSYGTARRPTMRRRREENWLEPIRAGTTRRAHVCHCRRSRSSQRVRKMYAIFLLAERVELRRLLGSSPAMHRSSIAYCRYFRPAAELGCSSSISR